MCAEILTEGQLEYLLAAGSEFQGVTRLDKGTVIPFPEFLAIIQDGHSSHLVTEQHCVKGEIVLREGDPGDAMYLIQSGRVIVFMGEVESPSILSTCEAGEIIGEMALLEKQPRSATVVALSELHLLRISRETFFQLLKNNPSLGVDILGMLSTRLRASDQARSRVRTSEHRLIRQLSELQTQNRQLLELEQLRQETIDLIVHDLYNPLGSISLALDMLAMLIPQQTQDESRQLLDIAILGATRLTRLVDNLLEVSSIEAGESELELTCWDMGALICEVTRSLLLPGDNLIQLRLDIAPELPEIEADRQKVERVLINLLDNALKYMPDGGTICVQAGMEEGQVRISVSDDGPGIPVEDRERIFERYTRADQNRGNRRGYGLGLAYCRLAVQAHGGRIWVEEDENTAGSRFVFILPLKPTEFQNP